MIDWGSRPISASGKLESIASASQKGTLNSEGEKLNATEEKEFALGATPLSCCRGALRWGPVWGALACPGCVSLADSDTEELESGMIFLPGSKSVLCCHW